MDGDPTRSGIGPRGAGDGWAASAADTGGGTRTVSVTLAHGAAEVRVHRVSGAAEGAPVRLTGWAAGPGLRSELHPLHGFDEAATLPGGPTAYSPTTQLLVLLGKATGDDLCLFIALGRLTAEPAQGDARPLTELAEVAAESSAITVRWTDGPLVRLTFHGEQVVAPAHGSAIGVTHA